MHGKHFIGQKGNSNSREFLRADIRKIDFEMKVDALRISINDVLSII
jgi:hypothetical protein